MRTKQTSWAMLGLLGPMLLATGSAADEGRSVPQDIASTVGRLTGLLDVVGGLPSLSGLIKPEKMSLLGDSSCRMCDNQMHLFSENETDVSLMSGNVVKILSGIHILSGISVDIRITVRKDDGKAAGSKAKKRHSRSRSHKAGKHDGARKPNG